MADISKEQAVQLAREAGFDISISQGLKNPTPEVFAANVLVTSEIERICQAAFKLGRNSGLDAAKNVALEYPKYGEATAEEIESLKDNTP